MAPRQPSCRRQASGPLADDAAPPPTAGCAPRPPPAPPALPTDQPARRQPAPRPPGGPPAQQQSGFRPPGGPPAQQQSGFGHLAGRPLRQARGLLDGDLRFGHLTGRPLCLPRHSVLLPGIQVGVRRPGRTTAASQSSQHRLNPNIWAMPLQNAVRRRGQRDTG